jgi:Protein of unknown function (DUF2971)
LFALSLSDIVRLYHLCPANHALQNLERKRLKVATFEDLNDPFELLSAKLSTRSLRAAFQGFKRSVHGRMGLLCFAPHWENPLMWSHYADKHRGICLGFDVSDQYAIPVKYIGARAAVRFRDDLGARRIDPTFAFELMCSKYEGWSYEEEIRMYVGFHETEPESGLHFYRFGTDLVLREVILGPRCSVPFRTVKALASAASKPPKVLKARLAFNSFRVVQNNPPVPLRAMTTGHRIR